MCVFMHFRFVLGIIVLMEPVFSLRRDNTEEEIDFVMESLIGITAKLRDISSIRKI